MKFLFAGKFFRGSFALFEHDAAARQEEILSLLGGNYEIAGEDDEDEDCDCDGCDDTLPMGFRSTE